MSASATVETDHVAAAAAILALDHRVVTAQQALDALDASDGTIPSLIAELTQHRDGQPPATTRDDVYAAIADTLGYQHVSLSGGNVTVDVDLIQDLGADLLLRHIVVPVRASGQTAIAAANPSVPAAVDIAARVGPDTPVWIADPLKIIAAVRKVERDATIDAVGTDIPEQTGGRSIAAPTIALDESSNQAWVRDTINRAIAERASDIHIGLSTGGHLRVAFRVDGVLRAQVAAGIDPHRAINTVVQAAGMDIGAQNQPQSSSFKHQTIDGRRYDIRAELLPTVNGADVTLRLLASFGLPNLDRMGLLDVYTQRLREVAARKQGLVLVTGPTGHGKTTTLYATLLEIRDGHRKIVAIEDPVEYRIDGVTQVQVAPRNESGLGWLSAISSALRSDPDVMLIGEIRDAETAQTAVHASQTGHLVLATLHTNNAVAAFARLRALGVEPVEIAAQTSLVTGQRLVPQLHRCAQRRPVDEQDALRLRASGIEPPAEASYPHGCEGCDGTGIQGRVPLVEMLSPDPKLRVSIAADADELELGKQLHAGNFLPFAQEARRLIDQGAASPDEVVKCLREEAVQLAAARAGEGA